MSICWRPAPRPVVLATIRVAKDSKDTGGVRLRHQSSRSRGSLKPRQADRHQCDRLLYGAAGGRRIFDLFLAIRPGLKTIGTIYNSGETNSEALNKLAKAEAEKRGLAWVAATITSSAEVKNAINSLIGKVDAVVTLQDNTVASAYEAIVKATRDAKVPWFAFDVLAVERGAIAALAQHQYQNGVDWARKVAAPVLRGQDRRNLARGRGDRVRGTGQRSAPPKRSA